MTGLAHMQRPRATCCQARRVTMSDPGSGMGAAGRWQARSEAVTVPRLDSSDVQEVAELVAGQLAGLAVVVCGLLLGGGAGQRSRFSSVRGVHGQ